MALISFTSRGIYCAQGDFYIDPWQPVNYAVTTHGHADHVRFGNGAYLCHTLTGLIIKKRISEELNVQTMAYGEITQRNGVSISFFPAGHIIGSAQVRLEYKGEICVVSGDYKLEDDGISPQFESVKCHSFVTESTFGLPIYKWLPQSVVFSNIKAWLSDNLSKGKTGILVAYSLGKAQRLIQNLAGDVPVYVHQSIGGINDVMRNAGIPLPETITISPEITKDELQKGIVIVPPVMRDSRWIKTLQHPVTGVCSGWMQVRANRRWESIDAGFPLSDHADWPALLTAVRDTGAEKVWVTHGFTSVFSRYLTELGLDAQEVATKYGTEDDEMPAEETKPIDEANKTPNEA